MWNRHGKSCVSCTNYANLSKRKFISLEGTIFFLFSTLYINSCFKCGKKGVFLTLTQSDIRLFRRRCNHWSVTNISNKCTRQTKGCDMTFKWVDAKFVLQFLLKHLHTSPVTQKKTKPSWTNKKKLQLHQVISVNIWLFIYSGKCVIYSSAEHKFSAVQYTPRIESRTFT